MIELESKIAHGGNVSARSRTSANTTYSILSPACEQEETVDSRRILLVDDVPELLLLLRKLIARMGYQVETAASAHEALEILREQKVDLLMTDWAMPGMNGGQLIAALKTDARLREIPVIVLTGHDTETERQDAFALGCDRFLVKPVERYELQSVITELLFCES